MWSKKWRTIIAFVLGLFMAVTLFKPALPQTSSLGIVIALAPPGQVTFKKPNRSNFQPAFIGRVLKGEDKLRVGSNARAIILCSNWTKWIAPQGRISTVSEGCPSTGKGRITSSEDYTGDTRGANDPNIPYILSPRKTSLINNRPTLRWHPVEGAQSYSVRVFGLESGIDWEIDTKETQIVYSGEQPLPPDYYWLSVETDKGQSSEEEYKIVFAVLSEEKAISILKEVEELQQQQLNEEAKSLALAHFYLTEDLKADAIELLEKSIVEDNQLVATYQLLGDIYKQIGLNKLAKERYLKGLELAQIESDLNSQAAIQKNLVTITLIIDGKDEALEWLEQAQISYEALGDESEVRQLEEQKNNILQGSSGV